MATKQIAWSTGGGYITLTYDKAEGNQTVTVTSDKNSSSSARSKDITIKAGTDSKTLTISQKAGVKKSATATLYPAAFVSGAYQSISNQNNPVGKSSSSTSYVNAYLKTGSRAETNLIYSFDVSSIPEDAIITSVTCSAKAYISNTQSNRISTRTVQLYSGSTAKGSAYTFSTSTTAFNLSCGTWTRDELKNCRIVVKAIRGTSNTTTNYYIRFYGATLTIKYDYY